jgi:hypothetical protein
VLRAVFRRVVRTWVLHSPPVRTRRSDFGALLPLVRSYQHVSVIEHTGRQLEKDTPIAFRCLARIKSFECGPLSCLLPLMLCIILRRVAAEALRRSPAEAWSANDDRIRRMAMMYLRGGCHRQRARSTVNVSMEEEWDGKRWAEVVTFNWVARLATVSVHLMPRFSSCPPNTILTTTKIRL